MTVHFCVNCGNFTALNELKLCMECDYNHETKRIRTDLTTKTFDTEKELVSFFQTIKNKG